MCFVDTSISFLIVLKSSSILDLETFFFKTMARKGGSKRRGKLQGQDGEGGDAAADYLSESHTIVTWNSGGGNTLDNDDPSWTIEDDYDVGGADTGDNEVAAAEQRHLKLVDAFNGLDDFFQEKRAKQRESMLKLWFKALTQYASTSTPPSFEYVWQQRDTLLKACIAGTLLRPASSPSEQYAACRVVEALAILQSDAELYGQVQSCLSRRIVASHHRAVPVRVAALRALGMASLLLEEEEVVEATMDLCEEVAQSEYRGQTTPASLRAAALQVWTVLATGIDDLYIAGKTVESTGRGLILLPLLKSCLEQTEDLSLQVAAGECAAYIHATRVDLGISSQEDTGSASNEPLNTTQRQFQQGSWEGSPYEDVMGEIEQLIGELSTQSGHHLSKKTKKEQRASFREYLATIQDNDPPEEVIQLRGSTTLELTSWKDIVVLQFVRRCLQGGFQFQLLTNSVLQTIFGLSLSAHSGNLSQLEKRLYLSKTSEAAKVKDQERHKQRNKRSNIKNHFLTADGEDF